VLLAGITGSAGCRDVTAVVPEEPVEPVSSESLSVVLELGTEPIARWQIVVAGAKSSLTASAAVTSPVEVLTTPGAIPSSSAVFVRGFGLGGRESHFARFDPTAAGAGLIDEIGRTTSARVRVGRDVVIVRPRAETIGPDGAVALAAGVYARASRAPALVEWESLTPDVVSTDGSGVVRARAEGRGRVVARYRESADTADIVVGILAAERACVANTRIIAHRAFGRSFPENTLRAIREAVAVGADYIEMDLRFTRDSVPVLMHDPTVDRTTNGTGAVSDLLFADLQKLDACPRLLRGGSCTVPTLREALAAVGDGSQALIDYKGAYDAALLRRMLAGIDSTGMRGRTVVASFDSNMLRRARAELGAIPTALLSNRTVAPDSVWTLGSRMVLIDQAALAREPDFAMAARREGVAVGGWTANSFREAVALRALGIRYIVTGIPIDRAALCRGS
jgi:glycerophosphoryl diester phosphodiesterase